MRTGRIQIGGGARGARLGPVRGGQPGEAIGHPAIGARKRPRRSPTETSLHHLLGMVSSTSSCTRPVCFRGQIARVSKHIRGPDERLKVTP